MELDLRKLIFIPIILFVVSVGILFYNYSQTGEFILKDVDLKGGTLITINTDKPVDVVGLEVKIVERFGSGIINGIKSSNGYGATIQVAENTRASDVLSVAEDSGIIVNNYEEETVGSFLGDTFFRQVTYILAISFILMSFVIFLIYRNVFSSFGIVFALLGNILTTIAFTSILGISMSFAGFAGLLMLIGFTVDSNIVLTSRVTGSGNESFKQRYKKALVTGITLVATITATMILVIFLSTSKLLVNIAEVLVIGFLADLIFTWIFNAGLLQIYFKRKHGNLGEVK